MKTPVRRGFSASGGVFPGDLRPIPRASARAAPWALSQREARRRAEKRRSGPNRSVRRNHAHADLLRVRANPPARMATVSPHGRHDGPEVLDSHALEATTSFRHPPQVPGRVGGVACAPARGQTGGGPIVAEEPKRNEKGAGMRIALHSVIAEGAIDDYRTHHARFPDGLRDLFGVAGIEEWTIWRFRAQSVPHRRVRGLRRGDAGGQRLAGERCMAGRISADSSRDSTAPTGKMVSLRSSRCGRCRRSGVPKAETRTSHRYLLDTRSACG